MLAGLSARFWAAMAAVGAFLALVAGAWLRGRQAGTDAARRRALEQAAEQRETRDAVERDVAREPDPVERLRDKWQRPGL